MKIKSPLIRAYRSCGFHNRTLKELRQNPEHQRSAILNASDSHLAHVPNVFGSFVHGGVKYHTELSLVGIDEPEEGVLPEHPRGVTVLKVKEINPEKVIWQFKVMIPKRFCEEELCPEGEDVDPIQFCMALCDRTDIFAMEFLCSYRFFIEQVLETYELGNSGVRNPLRDQDVKTHPKREEVEALICTYDAVARHLKWFQEKHKEQDWQFDSIQQFLELHTARNRRAMLPYYWKWLREHRVKPDLVEKKTIEYIAMAFLDHEHEN